MPNEFREKSLIFLISQPRAGSTLLQRILAGHPDILTSAEPWLMLHPVYALKKDGIEAEYSAGLAYHALNDFLEHYVDGQGAYYEALRAFGNTLYSHALDKAGKRYFLDKTPRYYLIIPDLMEIFPNAHFILLFRNPLAVLKSILTTWVGTDWPKLSSHQQDLTIAPYKMVEAINLLQTRATIVHYEQLVQEPYDTIARVCRALGVSFDPAMLEYGKTPPPNGRMGDSVGVYRHDMPALDSLYAWQSLTENPQTRHFGLEYLKGLGTDLIDKLGYCYDELFTALQVEPFSKMQSSIVPWHLAIQPSDKWSRKERLVVRRTMDIQKSGIVQGNCQFLRRDYRSIIRTLLEQ